MKMNELWPRERHAYGPANIADSSVKNARDFLALLDAFPNGLPRDFEHVVIWIVKQDGNLSELEQRTAQFSDKLETAISDCHPLLMTLACAAALAHTPTLQTWRKVNSFKYNSSQIAHWLSEAMMAYAEVHHSARSAYTMLAKKAFSALNEFALQSKSDHINEKRAGILKYWNQQQDKLGEIWWDLRGERGVMNYEEELPLFQVFYKLDSDDFICTISSSSNPYLVSALLFVAHIGSFSPQFSEWKRMITAVPVAFEDDGKWNHSVLMPLLLVEARNQLLQTRFPPEGPGLSSIEPDEIKQEITLTAQLIADSLATRQDAAAIFCRWTPWLMRQILGQTEKESADLMSTAFADTALIDAIGSKLETNLLPHTSPDDAPLWEAWYYRCALASFSYSGHIKATNSESFIDEWRLSPEDWIGDKGKLLRNHANLITIMNKEIPGVAANLLAYPIAQSPSPTKAWFDLWNDTIVLREIIEFGDSDEIEDEYSSRMEAGKLLLLLFRIGLAIFDQVAARSFDNNSPEARSLVNLFQSLNLAICEMREIDNTLNFDEWLLCIQHLVVRRMIWEHHSGKETAKVDFHVFTANDTPTVSDILYNVKGNVFELVTLLQSLMLNSPDVSRLKTYLSTASINLTEVMQSIRKLNQYNPRKYPIDETFLQKLEAY